MNDIDLTKFGNPNLIEKRRQLVEALKRRGILDNEVLKAIGNLPREKFIDLNLLNRSYEDNALPIECNQTISQPYTVA